MGKGVLIVIGSTRSFLRFGAAARRHAELARADMQSLEPRRLLSAGDLDSSFGHGGIAAGPDPFLGHDFIQVSSVEVWKDRTIVAGLVRKTATSAGALALVRYAPNGALDS